MIMGYTSPDKKFYHTDTFTSYAIDRLDEYKNEDKPFVLYLPYTAPHYPLHAKPEDIKKYIGKFRMGWDAMRRRRTNTICSSMRQRGFPKSPASNSSGREFI